MNLKTIGITLLVLGLGLLLGCSQGSAPAPTPEAATTATPTVAATSTPAADMVEVAKDGTRFDPPVPKEKIPNDAWACVMKGTVHYASMEKGEGKCPTCGMNLAQHAAHQDQ